MRFECYRKDFEIYKKDFYLLPTVRIILSDILFSERIVVFEFHLFSLHIRFAFVEEEDEEDDD